MSVKGYDTNVQLTQTKINVLKADTNWHSLNEKIFVGRYITSVNPNEKRLAPGEVELISAIGIDIVSLYQRSASSMDYFTEDQAFTDAKAAAEKAAGYHQPNGTPIYFCVDVAKVNYSDASIIAVFKVYFAKIKQTLAISAYNPKGYAMAVYGPEKLCMAIKNEYPSIYTMKGNPQNNEMTNHTIRQFYTQSSLYPTNGSVTVQVDRCIAQTSEYGGWQYHSFTGPWQNYNNPSWHRRKCSMCNQYEREAHTLNAMGTRCIVCGYDGPVAYPQKGGTDGETE